MEDEPFDVVAIVSHPEGEAPVLSKLLTSRSGVLNAVLDNVWSSIQKDFRRLFWTAKADDDNKAWHFERADGSFTRNGRSLFYYGVQDLGEVESIVRDFEAKGRIERAFLPQKYSSARAPSPETVPSYAAAKVSSGGAVGGVRSYSTSMRGRSSAVLRPSSSTRGYATSAAPSSSTQNVALIGARGFTGSRLVKLLSDHPSISLSHVSSRELAGQRLDGYTKAEVDYKNLSVQDVEALEERGEIDAWVMALPNGVCKPFVDAIDRVKNGKSVIVDIGADYRFENGWTYGLPGERSAP